MDERLAFSVAQAARLLGISKNLAYQLASDGRLPTIRISEKRLIVPRRALERFLERAGQGQQAA